MKLIEAIQNAPTQPGLGIYATDNTPNAPAKFGDFRTENGGIPDRDYVFICSSDAFQKWKAQRELPANWFDEFMDWLEG